MWKNIQGNYIYLNFTLDNQVYLRFMQRLVPGAKAQPEQHWWPPQTLGLNKGRHVEKAGWNKTPTVLFWAHMHIEGLFIIHRAITVSAEGLEPSHDKLNWLRGLFWFQIILMWLAYWYERLRDYAIIAFYPIKISGQVAKLNPNVDPQVPPSVMRESGVKTNIRVIWALKGLCETHTRDMKSTLHLL